MWVDLSHRWHAGLLDTYRRGVREARAVATFAGRPRYRLRDCLREWWSELPDDRHSSLAYRLDYRRMVALAGKLSGERSARQRE